MKKLLFLFILILLTGFQRCEKCKVCITTTTCTGTTDKQITTFEACGKDLKDVDGKTVISKVIMSGVSVTCTAHTDCN